MKECRICRILRTNDVLYICNECKEIIDSKRNNNTLYCSLYCKGKYEAKYIIGVQYAAMVGFSGVVNGMMVNERTYRGHIFWQPNKAPKIQCIYSKPKHFIDFIPKFKGSMY